MHDIVIGSPAASHSGPLAAGSRTSPCSTCLQPTYHSPATQTLLDRGARLICLDCYLRSGHDDIPIVTEEIAQEIAQTTGEHASPAEWALWAKGETDQERRRRGLDNPLQTRP